MEIDIPEALAEVDAAFEGYEQALVTNDVATLEACFATIRAPSATASARTSTAWTRSAPSAAPLAGRPDAPDRRTVITTYGRDFATASTLFSATARPARSAARCQSWVRFPEGWRVVGPCQPHRGVERRHVPQSLDQARLHAA